MYKQSHDRTFYCVQRHDLLPSSPTYHRSIHFIPKTSESRSKEWKVKCTCSGRGGHRSTRTLCFAGGEADERPLRRSELALSYPRLVMGMVSKKRNTLDTLPLWEISHCDSCFHDCAPLSLPPAHDIRSSPARLKLKVHTPPYHPFAQILAISRPSCIDR